jgi:hypothetical protein
VNSFHAEMLLLSTKEQQRFDRKENMLCHHQPKKTKTLLFQKRTALFAFADREELAKNPDYSLMS